MDAAVGHQRNLVVNALSDGQPVQRVSTGVMRSLSRVPVMRRAAVVFPCCRRTVGVII